MSDQVECSDLTGSSVVFYVARFASSGDVTSYVNTLVNSRDYQKGPWTAGGGTRGEVYTSPTSAGFSDVTTSICAMPTFLIQFYAESSARRHGQGAVRRLLEEGPVPEHAAHGL